MDEKQLAKLLDEATEKSLKDKNFRAEFIKDANAAIKKEFDKELPVKVTVHEFTKQKLVFVLPQQKVGNQELDEQDLNAVSGGRFEPTIRPVSAYACFPRYDDPFPQYY